MDARTILRNIQRAESKGRVRLLERKLKAKRPFRPSFGTIKMSCDGAPVVVGSGYTFTYSTVKDALKESMDELKKEFSEYKTASQEHIERLEERLKTLEQENAHTKEELESFKNITSLFLGKYLFDVDNISAEDLEYGLTTFEQNVIEKLYLTTEYKSQYYYHELADLCEKLEYPKIKGYNDFQNIKIFIKQLVRENHRLKEIIEDERFT